MRLLLFTLVWLVLLSGTALAHTPIFLREGVRSGRPRRAARGPLNTSPDFSWAYYGRLGPGSPVDVLPLQARQGQPLVMHLSIPQRRDLAGFQPRVVIVGPGLPEAIPADLPVSAEDVLGPAASTDRAARRDEAAPGSGSLTLPVTEGPTASSFEPFTQVHYWRYGEVTGSFPAAGRYAIIIDDPSGRSGPYTLAVGARERLGPKDILGFPLTWARIHVWLWK